MDASWIDVLKVTSPPFFAALFGGLVAAVVTHRLARSREVSAEARKEKREAEADAVRQRREIAALQFELIQELKRNAGETGGDRRWRSSFEARVAVAFGSAIFAAELDTALREYGEGKKPRGGWLPDYLTYLSAMEASFKRLQTELGGNTLYPEVMKILEEAQERQKGQAIEIVRGLGLPVPDEGTPEGPSAAQGAE